MPKVIQMTIFQRQKQTNCWISQVFAVHAGFSSRKAVPEMERGYAIPFMYEKKKDVPLFSTLHAPIQLYTQ